MFANVFERLGVIGVGGVGEGLAQPLTAPDPTAVLRRGGEHRLAAARVCGTRLGRADMFDQDRVFSVVAGVVGVGRLVALGVQDPLDRDREFFAERRLLCGVAEVTVGSVEPVQTALDRGSVRDRRRLIAVIDRDPWGTTARQVEHALTYSRPYGVANLMERVLRSARTGAERAEREVVAGKIKRAIADSGLTRAEFASRIGT